LTGIGRALESDVFEGTEGAEMRMAGMSVVFLSIVAAAGAQPMRPGADRRHGENVRKWAVKEGRRADRIRKELRAFKKDAARDPGNLDARRATLVTWYRELSSL